MKPIQKVSLLASLVGASTFGALALLFREPDAVRSFIIGYEKMQGNLFTGFLTIGGFLLSLKTFLLLRLKIDIYDEKKYTEIYRTLRLLDPRTKRYAPLENLSGLLVVTILTSLVTSLAQLTLGFLWRPYGAFICASFVITTLTLVFYCWFLLQQNLKTWFSFISHDSDNG